MTEVRIPDAGGDCVSCIRYNGILFPNFNTQAIKGLNSVKIRHDDVLLVAYPKSGNHMIWEMARKILTGNLEFDTVFMRHMIMELSPEERYAEAPSPRILTSHCLLSNLSPEVLEKKPRLLNIIRNPKDVAVSLYKFMKQLPYMEYTGTWENNLKSTTNGDFFYGSWCDHVTAWEKIKQDYPDWPILYVYYEDIIQNPLPELRKLSEFLGVERSDEFLTGVVELCTIENMKEHRVKNNLDAAVYRKGRVGDWKNSFTVAQNEWFEDFILRKMGDSKLALKYTVDYCKE